MDVELALLNAVSDPIESHIHCLGASDFGSAIGKPIGSGVVGGDPGGVELFSVHFCENVSNVCGFLAIVE